MKSPHPASPLVFALLLLPFSAAAQTASPLPQAVEPDSTVPVVLAPFEVTGSRVLRVDYETPAPVVTFSAAAIEEKGYDNFGDFVQSLPFNNNTANTDISLGSFIQGAATVNPRGLGSNRFLTLINGRRSVPHGLADSSGGTPQSMFNFNTIPSAAIERVEFLKDGASALYGSDAITGVFNLILKKSYHGTVVDYAVSNTLGHDTLNQRVSVTTGFAARGWEISVGAHYQNRHGSFLPDYGIASTDFRHLGTKGANLNAIVSNPSYLNLSAAQATAAGFGTVAGFYIVAGGQPTANPTKASFTYAGTTSATIPDANRLNLAPLEQVLPATESYGGFANLERRLTPQISAFAQFTFGRSTQHTTLPPFGLAPQNLAGFTLSASNPYNPLGIALTDTNTSALGFTFLSALRGSDAETRTATALAGLRGTARDLWHWETAMSYGVNDAQQISDAIDPVALQAALNGTTRATAYNPFGPSEDASLLRRLFVPYRGRDGRTDAFGYDASVNGSFYQLPWRGAGQLGLAAGYEFRHESLRFDPETAPAFLLGTAIPFSGHRQLHSFYAEFSVPVQKWLELQLAGRHERYSDFGQTTKPKVGIKIRLPANRFVNVLVRGSYSESFKAPDLGQLYQTQTLASAGNQRDPLRPQDGVRLMTAIVGGNRSLQPEEGKVQYAGVVFEVPAIKGLSLSADYFDIAIRGAIFNRSAAFILSPEGQRLFPEAIIRDNRVENPGPITFLSTTSANLGYQLYRGWDFGLKYATRPTRLGRFGFNADVTQTLVRGRDVGVGGGFVDSAGKYFAPKWRSNLGLNWHHKKISAAVNADITGEFLNNSTLAAGWREKKHVLINPSLTWRGFEKMTVTLGATNVFDRMPPPNGLGTSIRGFNDSIHPAGSLGRTLSLRVRKEF